MERRTICLYIGSDEIEGELSEPTDARGLVLFAPGADSSRHSPRNRFVADVLASGGLATLLVDLLTLGEEELDAITGELRFDVAFLARRLIDVTQAIAQQGLLQRGLALGLFGSGTGAAAALVAAARLGSLVSAVVSRGGRPDLAGDALGTVIAPTLLIVGGRDDEALPLNRRAFERLDCARRLAIVPGATHQFAEPGALGRVAELARDWFIGHLGDQSLVLPGGEPMRSE